MRKSLFIYAVVLLLALCAVALLLHSASAPPSFQGKPLAVWLRDLDFSHSARDIQASNAVFSMGTNVLPYLSPMFKVRDSDFPQTIRRLLSKQRVITVQLVPANIQHQRAARACRVLGPAAMGYLPELRVMLGSTNYATAWCAYGAITALKLSTNAVPEYVIALTNNYAPLRSVAADRLGSLGEQARAATKQLIQGTTDVDENVRRSSLLALTKIQVDKVAMLPLLLARLEDASPTVRKAAVESLLRYGLNSEPVLAKLQTCLADENQQVRAAASFALQKLRQPNQ